MAEIKLYTYEVETLPRVCMRCGAPAEELVRKKFSWRPTWVIAFILCNLLVFLLVALITTKRLGVLVPLCGKHRNHWSLRGKIIGGGFCAIVFAGFAGLMLGNAFDGQLGGMLCMGLVVILLLWVVVAIVSHETSIHATEITNDSITLARVAEEFVDAVDDQHDSEPRFVRVPVQTE